MKIQKDEPAYSLVKSIVNFVSQSRGLRFLESGTDELIICQSIDGKHLKVNTNTIAEVLPRKDSNKELFLQVNFSDGKKVILTDNLIGFKPAIYSDLDMNRLPKVVTTPDLISFIEVLEDSLYDTEVSMDEIEDVKQYFESVLMGAEAIGFNLICERIWIARLLNHQISTGHC
ncbi:MAG: hypothetical protein OXC37_03410 [Bdellovibrionaceae bacterium]|nr:hypothetical protein [Pseudobdellovibrionaceae bacterium]